LHIVACNDPKVVTFSHSIYYDPFLLASPLPQKYRSLFTLIKPLSPHVWLAILASVFLATLGLNFVVKLQVHLGGQNFKHWNTLPQASWYIFGTLIGESITRNLNIKEGYVIR